MWSQSLQNLFMLFLPLEITHPHFIFVWNYALPFHFVLWRLPAVLGIQKALQVLKSLPRVSLTTTIGCKSSPFFLCLVPAYPWVSGIASNKTFCVCVWRILNLPNGSLNKGSLHWYLHLDFCLKLTPCWSLEPGSGLAITWLPCVVGEAGTVELNDPFSPNQNRRAWRKPQSLDPSKQGEIFVL